MRNGKHETRTRTVQDGQNRDDNRRISTGRRQRKRLNVENKRDKKGEKKQKKKTYLPKENKRIEIECTG